jgi:hypothetical protein
LVFDRGAQFRDRVIDVAIAVVVGGEPSQPRGTDGSTRDAGDQAAVADKNAVQAVHAPSPQVPFRVFASVTDRLTLPRKDSVSKRARVPASPGYKLVAKHG